MKVEAWQCDICSEGRTPAQLSSIGVNVSASNVYEKDTQISVREACDGCRQKVIKALDGVIPREFWS